MVLLTPPPLRYQFRFFTILPTPTRRTRAHCSHVRYQIREHPEAACLVLGVITCDSIGELPPSQHTQKHPRYRYELPKWPSTLARRFFELLIGAQVLTRASL